MAQPIVIKALILHWLLWVLSFYVQSNPLILYITEKMGPKKAKKGGPQSPGEETKGGGEKMTELDKEWYLIQIKSLGNTN